MEQLNNLDVVFLVIVAISILVSVARGFIKEVLSILGWILAGVAVYYLLPVVEPITKKYIQSELLVTIVNSMGILLLFCILWILLTDKLSFQIRNSKFSVIDRILGILFGLLRGVVVVILVQIMISSLIPEEAKQGIFAESKYFKLAEESSKPIKDMIPEKWIEEMKEKALVFNLDEDKKDESKVANTESEKKSDIITDILQKSGDELFDQLVQPKIADENNNLETLKQGLVEAVELIENVQEENKSVNAEEIVEIVTEEVVDAPKDELDELLDELEDIN